MKIICVASMKGGVGKTTIDVFLSQALALSGNKVLTIDMDPNNNLTDYFLRDVSIEAISARNIRHVITGRISIEEAIYSNNFDVDCIPATPKLASINSELNNDFGSVIVFEKTLRGLNYDYIILDSPPADCFELRTSLYVSDLVLCPISYSRWSLQGFEILDDMIGMNRKAGKNTKIICVPSNVSPKKSEGIIEIGNEIPVTATHIARNESLENAVTLGSKIKANSIAGNQFNELAKEISI
ncbi:AAA family ATPase [Leptospira santarosai]|uniref:ParA family protein n=1 Tax=Leptospira santarosai TaxID=28183 RepID=UPI0024AE9322|nr:AAA family ATPase [Leptospira santarosai]MDI7202052.1 AAA family ATPase [Leptospira santarosai]